MITNKTTEEFCLQQELLFIHLHPPSVNWESHPDVDSQSTTMLSGHYDPGTSMALNQLTMTWHCPCREDPCPRVGFQSHSSVVVSFSRKKKTGLSSLQSHRVSLGGHQGRWDTGVERVGCEGRGELNKNERDQGRREWMSILPILTPERPLSSLAHQANGQLARRRCDTPFPAHQPRQMSPLPPPSRAPATSWPRPPPKTIQE